MRSLSAHDIVGVWETGREQHSLDRALTILSAAMPRARRDQLSKLAIGQRDRLLLDLREMTYGSDLRMFAECPECAGHLEIRIATSDLRLGPEPGPDFEESLTELCVDDMTVIFRLANSCDLAAVANSEDAEAARGSILRQCFKGATVGGASVQLDDLSAEVMEMVGERMAECDPQAEIRLDLECPVCSHAWQAIFDISTFLWKEIAAHAKRLMREVHTLAAAYKWHEADILSMNPSRRRYYLELVT
jgi:hypothetical protein